MRYRERRADANGNPASSAAVAGNAAVIYKSRQLRSGEDLQMAKYLLVESRDPLTSADVARCYELARELQDAGNEVTLFLLENGVLPARKSPASARLSELAKAGVTVLADDFSLRERGITDGLLAEGVIKAELESVVDGLEQGARGSNS
jgi:sulfur relay (sulfurtransferase) complex TusBCD TusD component (DsrE family)